MGTPFDSMRLIHWASGAPISSQLPISDREPDVGLLGPDSPSWCLHEEQWLITAGARASLLQAAHPKIAQGALDHSSFAEDPFGRVYRTIRRDQTGIRTALDVETADWISSGTQRRPSPTPPLSHGTRSVASREFCQEPCPWRTPQAHKVY